MRLVRLLAAAGVAALIMLAVPGAGPALADNNATITSPSDTAYDAYPAIAGAVTQSGSSAQVTKVDLALTSVDGWTSENTTLSYTRGASNSSAFSEKNASEVDFNWVPKPRYNGRYTISVNGSGTYNAGLGGTRTETSGKTQSFNIEVPPAKPTGAAAGMPEGSTQATITWNANSEPDLVGYKVVRSYQNGSPREIAEVGPSTKPTYKDDLTGAPQGAYKYAVIAFRHARTCKTDSSDTACTAKIPSAQSGYSAAVTVRATPATTTTTSTTIKKGGGSSGGSTGGSSGGSTGGSSGGSSGGTKGGGSTATGGTKSSVKNSGGYAPGGNVDLSQFGSLLTGNGKTTKNGDKVDEGTYDPELKGYDSSEKPVDSGDKDNSLITIGGASLPAPSDDWVRFIGAGSLVTALLVHVLWFKQQVDSIPLEAISE